MTSLVALGFGLLTIKAGGGTVLFGDEALQKFLSAPGDRQGVGGGSPLR